MELQNKQFNMTFGNATVLANRRALRSLFRFSASHGSGRFVYLCETGTIGNCAMPVFKEILSETQMFIYLFNLMYLFKLR